jgi:hypothetical protein
LGENSGKIVLRKGKWWENGGKLGKLEKNERKLRKLREK